MRFPFSHGLSRGLRIVTFLYTQSLQSVSRLTSASVFVAAVGLCSVSGEGGCWSLRGLPGEPGGLSSGFVAFLSFFLVSLIKMTLNSRERSTWHRIESFMLYLLKVPAN